MVEQRKIDVLDVDRNAFAIAVAQAFHKGYLTQEQATEVLENAHSFAIAILMGKTIETFPPDAEPGTIRILSKEEADKAADSDNSDNLIIEV